MPRSPLLPPILALALALAAGCAEAERTHQVTLPADGVTRVFSDVDRGGLVLSGTNPDEIALVVRTFARGPAAKQRLERVVWGAAVTGDLLDLWGRSRAEGAGVDFVAELPPALDVEAVLLDGGLELHDLTGDCVITADEIVATGLTGSLDLLASTGGISLEATPEPGDVLVLEAHGDTDLTLPYGVELDLQVFPDPDFAVDVADLGFDQLDASPDYVRGVTGSGAVRVEVVVHGGTFSLWNAER